MSTVIGPNATLEDILVLYKDNIPVFFFNLFYNYLPSELLEYNIKKLVRIIIIICGYIFVRKIIMKHQLLRAKKAQFEDDMEEISTENVDDLFEKDANEIGASSAISESGWGWGQKTKKDIEKKQAMLKSISQVDVDGDDDDADIADLLED